MNTRTILIVAFLVAFWLVLRTLGLYTDWLWFSTLGFSSVYRALECPFGIGAVGGAAFFSLVMADAR